MIVDDNSVMRRTIGRVVRDLVDPIIECSDGAEAFDAYQQNHPDWVFMDIEMKEKDGLTATREICAFFPDARIVIITKHSDPAMREAALKAGACDYVIKENLLDLQNILTAEK